MLNFNASFCYAEEIYTLKWSSFCPSSYLRHSLINFVLIWIWSNKENVLLMTCVQPMRENPQHKEYLISLCFCAKLWVKKPNLQVCIFKSARWVVHMHETEMHQASVPPIYPSHIKQKTNLQMTPISTNSNSDNIIKKKKRKPHKMYKKGQHLNNLSKKCKQHQD